MYNVLMYNVYASGVTGVVDVVVQCADVIICFVPSLRLIYWLIFDLPGELFATHGLHQEHEAPDTHRSEDCEEDDCEPEGCLGDETGQFVHKLCRL